MLTHIHPSRLRLPCRTRPRFNGPASPARSPGLSQGPPGAQSPFARTRCTLVRRGVLHPVRGHYPSFIAHTNACARPQPSRRLRLSLLRQVFAGCCQSLLGVGPSRRDLCESVGTCLDPYPGGLLRCSCPFLPGTPSTFSPFGRDRLSHHYPYSDFRMGKGFRGCSHLIIFRPALSLATLVAPTLTARSPSGSRDVYFRAPRGLLPPHAPDIRAVRTGQLTAEDFHPIRLAALSAASPNALLCPALPFDEPVTSAGELRAARQGEDAGRKAPGRFRLRLLDE